MSTTYEASTCRGDGQPTTYVTNTSINSQEEREIPYDFLIEVSRGDGPEDPRLWTSDITAKDMALSVAQGLGEALRMHGEDDASLSRRLESMISINLLADDSWEIRFMRPSKSDQVVTVRRVKVYHGRLDRRPPFFNLL